MYGIRVIYFKGINKNYKNKYLDSSQEGSSAVTMTRDVQLLVQGKFSRIISSTHLFSKAYGCRDTIWKCPVFQNNHAGEIIYTNTVHTPYASAKPRVAGGSSGYEWLHP
jgi:hypothetical protein